MGDDEVPDDQEDDLPDPNLKEEKKGIVYLI